MEAIKKPLECTSLLDIRNEIDRVDHEIMELLLQRYKYVREVVKYKNHDRESIQAQERYNNVIKQRGEWGKEMGLDPVVIEKIYKLLLDYFISEELKLANIKNS
jgi:isochorismate pyruvate lyase